VRHRFIDLSASLQAVSLFLIHGTLKKKSAPKTPTRKN
jgi:hypothetical protein